MLRVWSEEIFTLDAASSKRVFQPFKCLDDNIVLERVRLGLVGVNNPTFNYAFCEIYSYDDVAEVPTKLLYTSSQVLKTQITTLDSFVKEVPFNFQNVSLKKNNYYAVILRLNGYTYSSSSFLGFRKDFPDPAYKTNNDASSIASVGSVSYWARFIGAKF